MSLKLKFVLPNIQTAHQANKAFLQAGFDEKQLSFLAKSGADLGGLPEANAIEATNTLHEGVKGILMGAGLGLLGGLYVLYFPKWFTESPTWFTNASPLIILVSTALMGAIAAAFGAALLGVNLLNTDLKQFKSRIDHGAVLMIVNTSYGRFKEARRIINNLNIKN